MKTVMLTTAATLLVIGTAAPAGADAIRIDGTAF